MKILFRLFLAFLASLVLDAFTKIWAEQMLEPYTPVPIIGDFFRFTLGYNTGVAFGMFANGGVWPLVVTSIVIIFLFTWFTRALYTAHFSAWTAWPIGLLLGGAVGNFIDRIYDGQVTDFIDVGVGATRWPTFNLADSFILIGVGFLVLSTFIHHNEQDNISRFDKPSGKDEVDTFLTDVENAS